MALQIGKNVDIDDSVEIGSDVVLRDNVNLRYVVVGPGTKIGRNTIIFGSRDHPVQIGTGCFISPNCFMNGAAGLSLGDEVTIAPGVNISTDSGPNVGPLKEYYPTKASEITIGAGAWVGSGAVLLPGAQMGAASVLGANSALTAKVGPYEVFAGNLAKRVKRLDVQK